MHSNSHDIQQNGDMLMASPVSQWLSHNKQLYESHNLYHKSLFRLISHELLHKTSSKVLKVLKVAHKQIALEWRKIPHIGRYGGHKWHEVFGLGIWKHEKHSLSVQVFG